MPPTWEECQNDLVKFWRKEFYSTQAAERHLKWHEDFIHFYEMFISTEKPARVLDVGCGYFYEAMFNAFKEHLVRTMIDGASDVVLVEPSPNLFSGTAELLVDNGHSILAGNVSWLHRKMENLDSKHLGLFDRVFCLGALDHMEDPQLAMKNIAGCLRDDTSTFWLAITVYDTPYKPVDERALHQWTAEELLHLVESSGLRWTTYHLAKPIAMAYCSIAYICAKRKQ